MGRVGESPQLVVGIQGVYPAGLRIHVGRGVVVHHLHASHIVGEELVAIKRANQILAATAKVNGQAMDTLTRVVGGVHQTVEAWVIGTGCDDEMGCLGEVAIEVGQTYAVADEG